MRSITAATILAIAAFLGLMPAQAAEAPQTLQEPPRRVVASTSTQPTTTTTTPLRRPLDASDGESCVGWIDIAREVGWPETELPMVGAVTWQESRCLNTAIGDKGKSWTAWQIHTTSWCKPNRYYPTGYLQHIGLITTCQDLLDPHTSARAALAIWQYGGWKQWTTWKAASTTLNP